MSKFWKIAIAVLVVLLGVVAFAGWWFVVRDDAPRAAALVPRDTTAGAATGTADGTWTVRPGDEVFAGYRVTELFAGETIKKTAVGRSPAVTGTLTVQGSQIPAADVTVDVTKLTSDQSRRDSRIKSDGIQTDQFPTATFTLTQPIALPGPPAAGAPVDISATGDLTLHGVTKSVTIPLQARWNGDTIDVAGQAPIALADYNISPPSVGGFVTVDGDGTFELQLTFVRA